MIEEPQGTVLVESPLVPHEDIVLNTIYMLRKFKSPAHSSPDCHTMYLDIFA
jgi:hypothetical protein